MHLSFARCFFFYLSFLFPPVEPGVFNCCVTIKVPQSKSPAVFLLFADAQFVGCGDSTHRCRDSGIKHNMQL